MADESTVTPEVTPAEKTYTQAELESYVSKAINEYAKKSKERAAKSTDQRVAELEAELARRDNLEAVRKSMKENSIPESLEALFTGDNYEDKIKQFTEWSNAEAEARQKASIASVSPIHLNNSEVSVKKGPKTLAQIAAEQKGI